MSYWSFASMFLFPFCGEGEVCVRYFLLLALVLFVFKVREKYEVGWVGSRRNSRRGKHDQDIVYENIFQFKKEENRRERNGAGTQAFEEGEDT